jgi:hypothetical protein
VRNVDYVFAIRKHGIKFIPLIGKVPARDKNGVHIGITRATSEPATIQEWFGVDGVHNIGGVVPPWFVVIDVDPRHGGIASLERMLSEAGIPLPSTYTTRSGRNDGGIHLWFRKHEGVKLSAKGYPGIDLKDGSGYLVMPGSIHPETGLPYTVQNGGAIIDLPAALYPLLMVKPVPRRVVSDRKPTRWGMNGLAAHVRKSVEGIRNDTLLWALCEALRCGYPQTTIDEILQAGEDVGLPPEEVATVYRSALMLEGRK